MFSLFRTEKEVMRVLREQRLKDLQDRRKHLKEIYFRATPLLAARISTQIKEVDELIRQTEEQLREG